MEHDMIWSTIETYFRENPNFLVKHHLDSYNDFFNNKIHNIFREKNPIQLFILCNTYDLNYLLSQNL